MKWRVSERLDEGLAYIGIAKVVKIELLCEHGIGHSPYWSHDRVHGCDGCCGRADFPGRKPEVGDLALCGAGWLGMITSDQLQPVTYPDGNKAMAWTGIHLIPKAPEGGMAPLVSLARGQWSSRNPVIIGNIRELVANLNFHLLLENRLIEGWPCRGLTA